MTYQRDMAAQAHAFLDELQRLTRRIWQAADELEAKYNPAQPRMPRGCPEGGQWCDDSTGNSTNTPGPSPMARFVVDRSPSRPAAQDIPHDRTPPIPAYRAQAINKNDWRAFASHAAEQSAHKNEAFTYREVFAAEGGMAKNPMSAAVAGIMPATLAEARRDPALASKLSHIRKTSDITLRDVLPIYRFKINEVLNKAGGVTVLSQIGSEKAAAALVDPLFRHGKYGGGKIIFDAVNDVLAAHHLDPIRVRDEYKDNIVVGKEVIEKYIMFSRSSAHDELLKAIAKRRREKVRSVVEKLDLPADKKRGLIKAEINRIDNFTFGQE